MRCRRELNTRREILYPQATMCYFVYHINKIALHWLEKSTLLMDENKRIDNPWISALAPRLKMEKCVEKLQEQTMSVIFNIKKFSVVGLVLTDRRNLPGRRPKSACGKPFSCRFSFSAARNVITKVTEYVTFCFSFRILVFFPFRKVERHCLLAIWNFSVF